MYNAASKFTAVLITALAITSCGNSDKEAAQELSTAAENEIKAGNYQAAVILLDSLDSRYAQQIDVRRSAMKFRAMAVEGLTLRRITAVDDTIAVLKSALDKYDVKFEYVTNPGKNLGGNFIAKSIAKDKSDILPRVNDEGYFILSVRIPGRSIGFNCVRFEDGGASASTVPVDQSRLVKVENTEMTVLQQEDVADAMNWLTSHPTASSYQLVGAKNTVKQKLTQRMSQALIETWAYASDKQAYRLAMIEREKLERKLKLCRDQLANVIDR